MVSSTSCRPSIRARVVCIAALSLVIAEGAFEQARVRWGPQTLRRAISSFQGSSSVPLWNGSRGKPMYHALGWQTKSPLKRGRDRKAVRSELDEAPLQRPDPRGLAHKGLSFDGYARAKVCERCEARRKSTDRDRRTLRGAMRPIPKRQELRLPLARARNPGLLFARPTRCRSSTAE